MTAASAMQPTTADLRALLAPHQPPCISLYEPAHRSYPASSHEDPARYRNLLHRAEESLRERYPAHLVQPVLEKLERFGADNDFWIQAAAGLAIFSSADDLKVFKLQQPVPELFSVADRFQIKPLVRSIQRNGRYQVLALTLTEAGLYEGTQDSLEPVDLEGQPTIIAETLGPEPDRERFFRVTDREVFERASKISRLPLVLAALPEHQTRFRALSHNTFLAATGIQVNPEALTPGELRDAAWRAIEPYFEERAASLLEAYGAARSHGRGTSRLEDIAAGVAQSRVGTLLVEADRRIPGSVDAVQGTVTIAIAEGWTSGAATDLRISDVLDDLAEAALRTGAEVIVLEADRMPSRSGAAAVFLH